MSVWLLEYRMSNPRGTIDEHAACRIQALGHDWVQARIKFPPVPNSRELVVGSTSDGRCVRGVWLGYYLIQVSQGQDGAALARKLRARLNKECKGEGWEWQSEVRTPSKAELRPLVERYPKAKSWALLALFPSVYCPPWTHAKPGDKRARQKGSGVKF
jgi:hypothetical protein